MVSVEQGKLLIGAANPDLLGKLCRRRRYISYWKSL